MGIPTLAGCYDYVHGISRIREESPLPGHQCIESAARDTAGVSGVLYKRETGGRPLTWHGIEEPNEIHRYVYNYSDLTANLYFMENYRNEVEFHHDYLYINSTPTQEEIDRIRPVMVQIERNIEKNCSLQGFMSGIEESCYGVNCDD